MEDLCTGCLSTGRKLVFIGDTGFYNIYVQIMNEIPVLDLSVICVRMCWECCARLRGFHLFSQRAVRSLTDLMQFQQTPLHSTSKLNYQPQHNLSYPELPSDITDVEVKTEDDVKWPVEHYEPEAFADALSPEPLSEDDSDKPLRRKKKAKLKTHKTKVKKNRKKKETTNTEDNIDDIKIEETDYKDNYEEKGSVTEIADKTHKIKGKKTRKKKATIDTEDSTDDVKIEETDFKDSDRGIEEESLEEKEIAPVVEEPVIKLIKLIKVKEMLPVVKRKRGETTAAERPQCQECGKVFSSKKTYRYHLNVLHKGQNKYPCPRCGKVYQWKSNLGRHMRSHKAVDEGELFCAVCDKSFASVATFRQHLRLSRRHVPEADFSFACEECGKRFVNKTRLRDHIDWEHLNRIKFRCQLCDKPFKCHTSLYVHTQNVHVGKEKKDNLCHVCGKSYQNAAKLKYHITAMHSGETPYRCAHCAAAFGWYSSLYRHMREVHYKMKGVGKKAKKPKQREEPPQYAPL